MYILECKGRARFAGSTVAPMEETKASKWERALHHMREVRRIVDGEDFGGYVDVPSAVEAIDDLIDDLEAKAREERPAG